MSSLDAIAPYDGDGALRVVVEAPKGATVKLKFDAKLAVFTVSRPLPLGMAYPFDWGFVPGTLAEDGDPVDALLLDDQGTFPGVVVACQLIGVVEVEQRGERGGHERNDRLVVLPNGYERLGKPTHPRSLPPRLRAEIERFFLDATFFTGKNPRILGWKGATNARELVSRGIRAFRRKHRRGRRPTGT